MMSPMKKNSRCLAAKIGGSTWGLLLNFGASQPGFSLGILGQLCL